MKKVVCVTLAMILLTGCSTNIKDYFTKNDKKTEDVQPNNEQNQQQEEPNTEENNSNETTDDEPSTEVSLQAQYFNAIETIGDLQVITNPDNIVALVNKEYVLPEDYIPEDLVRPDLKFSFGDEDVEKSYLRKEAAKALEEMFAEAEKENIFLFAVSGYRSYQRQADVFQASVATQGEEHAFKYVAQPGMSEHQSGLAIDISAHSVNFELEETLEDTVEGKWMKENAHLFGYVLRYPKEKVDITKYEYEPWHFRYVGKEIAETIYKNDWTLEEFFENAKKI